MTDATMLQFDYETVDGAIVAAVLGKRDEGGSWQSVAIVLESRAMVLSVDADSDQISVDLEAIPEGPEWAAIESMKIAVGSVLGWCWIGKNYRGYLDYVHRLVLGPRTAVSVLRHGFVASSASRF